MTRTERLRRKKDKVDRKLAGLLNIYQGRNNSRTNEKIENKIDCLRGESNWLANEIGLQ